MPYRYLDDLTVADVAFEARGSTLEDVFIAAWEATLGVMVENPESIGEVETRDITLEEPNLDFLLHNFLQELLFFKDAEGLLMRIEECRIRCNPDSGEPARLEARARGEQLDPRTHILGTDVKAVTFYRYELTRERRSWKATVVLDV
jgi:SHS2 domain-containing protein